MFEQINSQMLTMGKNFADIALKANTLAMGGFERIADLQLKALESGVTATVEFWSEAAEIRDFDGAKTLWPKGVALVKDSAEKAYSNSQEVFGLTLKTTEAIGALVKGSFESANENFVKPTVAAAKKGAK